MDKMERQFRQQSLLRSKIGTSNLLLESFILNLSVI